MKFFTTSCSCTYLLFKNNNNKEKITKTKVLEYENTENFASKHLRAVN